MRVTRTGSRIALAALAAFAVTAASATTTIATFADPAADSTTPLFTLAGNQFQGAWSGTGLDLLTPGVAPLLPGVSNAKFTMAPLTATPIAAGFWTLSGGEIDFTDALNTPVFTIKFDAASLASDIGFGASDLALQNVTFSVPGHTNLVFTQERFAFSFANDVLTSDGTTWTAAFTSSANTTIPEPASVVLLVLGLLGSLRRIRV